jgi:hypothetical protein
MSRNQQMIERIQSIPVQYPFRFTMCGDCSPVANDPLQDVIFGELLNQMEALEPKPLFFVEVGDFAGPGSDEEHQRYLHLVDEKLTIPNLTTLGNHEIQVPNGLENYKRIHGEPNYAFAYGNTAFIAIHAGDYPSGPSEADLAFLEQSLKTYSHYPCKIVFNHVPPNMADHYSPVGHCGFSVREPEYINLLHSYDVRLVCSAHVTAYDYHRFGVFDVVVSGASGFSQLMYGPPVQIHPPYRGNFHHFVEISVEESGQIGGRLYRAFQGTRDLEAYRFGTARRA